MEKTYKIKPLQWDKDVIPTDQYGESKEDEHKGMWLHGGIGTFKDGNFLYVTDELKEALHYARIKGGNVYKLKDEYNHMVSWAMGQSEGMISQEDLKNNGGFNNVFELFIDLKGKENF